MEDEKAKADRIYKPGEPWETFPPNESDKKRLREYERHKRLFKCEHARVFDRAREWLGKRTKGDAGKRLYIAANFPRVISTLIADLLFSEPLRISVPDNLPLQKRLRDMADGTDLRLTLYESALSGSYRRGAVLKARWDKRRGASISSVPNKHYFPHPDPDDLRTLLGETIAWLRCEGDAVYLRREIHTPGHVRQELWRMDGDAPKEQVQLKRLGIAAPEDLDTGCPGSIVEYVTNTRCDDDLWGESDYKAIEGDLEALNDRLSRLHRVLNVHSEPIFVGPPGLLEEIGRGDGELGKYEYDKESKNAIEAPDKDTADIVRYVTWDAHLAASFSEIDRLLDVLMISAEISPDMFGMGKGGYAESGRALKMRWARQLAKRQRREMAYDAALRRLLRCAATLDNKFGDGPEIQGSDKISILWGDGLPNDPKDTAEEESLLLSAGISSRKSSYMRAMQAEEEDAEREMRQIAKERGDEMASILAPAAGGEGGHAHEDGGDG
jgi:hypothetical protein